jgi:LacI family transcriptional regulator, galactose operon repressor
MNVHVKVHVNVHVRNFSLTTMAKIARTLGVSVQTVSAVVNGKPGISNETQTRVRDAIVELDYHPNVQARTLRGVRSKTLGVIIPSITNPYFPEFVRGVEDAARARGYSIFLCNTDAELKHLLEYFALIMTNRASGLICAVGLAWLNEPEVVRWIRRFASDDVSVVLNGRRGDDLPVKATLIDANKAVDGAARHLLQLGHRRIGLILPPSNLSVAAERSGQYRAAFAKLGQPLDEKLMVPGDFELEAGAAAARRLMKRRDRPTAILAANDLAAFGAISALSEMGLRVPEDVSVVGFDDIAFARVFLPALTTIAQPVYDLGREAFRLATTHSPAEGEAGEVVTLEGRFVPRNSTGPVR